MKKRVAWIVGGVTGLGVQIIRELAENGYHIATNYRRSQKAGERLKQELEQKGYECLLMQGDAGSYEDIARMTREVMDVYGRIDAVVLTAGPFIFRKIPTVEFELEQWRELVEGNLSSFYYLTKSVIPIMRQQKFGRLLTFGYPEAEYAPAWEGFSLYAAAKSGLVSLTRTLAKEEVAHGITVNMVIPGDIRHPYKEAPISAARGVYDEHTPVGRPGTGGDIARVVRFLLEDDSDFITGAVIPVTGGFDNH